MVRIRVLFYLIFLFNYAFANESIINKKNFNEKELEYIKDKKSIKMCVDPDWLPFENIEKGKHTGIVADIYKIFEKELGIPIKLVITKTWANSLEKAKNKECDILSAAAQTPQREEYLNFTKSYLQFPQVIVTREKEQFIENFNDIIHKKIGVKKGSAVAELIKQKYPNINLIDLNGIENGLYKVSSGELYGFVNTTAALSFAISKYGMTNLKIASKVGIDYHLKIAVRKDNMILLNIMNKLIDTVDKKEIKKIKQKWLNVKMHEIIDYSIVYEIIAFFIFIIFGIIYWNKKLKTEIEQRKKIEKELQTQKEQLEKIFSHIPIPVLIVAKSTKNIIFANEYSAKIYKIKLNQLVGEKIDTLYTANTQRTDILSAVNEDGVLINYETSYKAKDGSHIDALLSLIPINFDGLEANLGVVTDVTYLKKIQSDLKEETKKAQNADSTKSDFLAKMSHEIRTPMNAVLGMLYLTQKTNLNSIQENYINKAQTAANSLLSIIDDILDFSKIEANKLIIENKEFNFNDMIHKTMDIMSFKAQEKGIEFLAYYDSTIPAVIKSDKLRIEQILNNLISNAIKFTDIGEVVVSSKLIKVEKDIATIMFCIKDSGIGIDDEDQAKLFKDFSQVDDTITRKFGGTGLGLAISKKLSILLGGKIWIEESKAKIGSRFCFTIQCEISQNNNKQYMFPKEINDINILIIDDNDIACDVLKSILKSFNFNVDVTNSGQDGYEAIANTDKKYDLVFLDYKMPKLNGIQTYKKIKTIVNKPIPKTIMITAYSQDNILEEITKLGIQNYLTKPVSPSTLYDTIIEVLNPNQIQNKILINKEEFDTEKLNNIKILLVEDNKLNQEFAKVLLQSVNISVDIANDGIEALNMVKSKIYDTVLMDIQMPNMDGLTATKLIRDIQNNDKYFKDLPIIALSANALVGDRQKSLDAGMNEHISKPIVPNELFSTIKKFLKDFKPTNITYNATVSEEINSLSHEVIDAKEALARIGGNETAYIKLLKQFSLKYKDVFKDIEYLRNNKDIKNLKNKIHEIKGVAGNLSAKKLFATLNIINDSLKIDETPKNNIYEELKKDFNDLFQEISNLTVKRSDKKEFDKDKARKLLGTIKDNLESDIVICENSLEELIPYLEGEYISFSNNLSQALNEFDIDKAFNLIEDFLQELNSE